MKNTKKSTSAPKHSKPKEKHSLFGHRRGEQPQPQPKKMDDLAPEMAPENAKAKENTGKHGTSRPRRGGWKWVLLTVFLLILLIAGWTAYAWQAKVWPFSEQLQTDFFHLYSM